MADVREKYNFTVDELLSAAGRQRRSMECGDNYDTDHVVELQLVVAALNTLPVGTYYRKGWERDLVDFFNDEKNLQPMEPEENREKGQAVTMYIRYRNSTLTKKQQKWLEDVNNEKWMMGWIDEIEEHWSGIRGDMDRRFHFKLFQDALDDLLQDVDE